MGESEELTRAVKDLRKEVEELRQLLTVIMGMVIEEDYADEDFGLNKEELQKLLPQYRNLYN
ncbi:MAG: hypothetical protein QCI38_01530 [Candidatus Thermoplasmatota archaeon]|nr:hypothetical protein [Candidatus Thermoplasmatota archaeon]